MKKFKVKHIAYLFIFLPFVLQAQDGWEKVDVSTYLEAIRNFENSIPENSSYSLSMKYKIYNDYADLVPIKTSLGMVICKDGKALNVSQMGIFLVQDENISVTIDSVNHKILLQKPDQSFFYRKTLDDFKIAEEIIKEVKKKETKDMVILNIELIKGAPYEAMEIFFLGGNEISRIEIYGNRPYYSENGSDMNKRSKVVIDFGTLKTGENVELKDFRNIDEFIRIYDGEVTTTKEYKGFEIIDLRN